MAESILDSKIDDNGHVLYQVQFLKFPTLQWVPASSLDPRLIMLYNEGKGDNLWTHYYSEEADVTGDLGHGLDGINEDHKCNTDKETDKKPEIKFKRHRTAGVQVFCCGCGVVISFYENFRSETKAQIWMQLIHLIETFPEIDWINKILGIIFYLN